MTNNTLTLRSFDIPSINKFGIGFDNIFDELQRISLQQGNQNYPPYNVVKYDENTSVIELAVAGFREGDITVTVGKNQLTIVGEKVENLDELDKNVEYIHRGISSRSFNRTFAIANYVEVTGADVSNGILSIKLERKIPEELKPRTIAISFNK
jgi:molecular chaperone IbpA